MKSVDSVLFFGSCVSMEEERVSVPPWLAEWIVADGKEDGESTRPCGGGRRRIALVQGRTMQSSLEAANVVEAVHMAYRCAYVVFHEHSLNERVVNGDTSCLAPLIDLTARLPCVGIIVSCEEAERSKIYVSCFAIELGGVVCRYRKRRAVHAGTHAEGNEVGEFDSQLLLAEPSCHPEWSTAPLPRRGVKCAVMICFDVENADVRDETLAVQPKVLFNPTWIPSQAASMRKYPSMFVAGWRSALDSMRFGFLLSSSIFFRALLTMVAERNSSACAGSTPFGCCVAMERILWRARLK